VDLGLDTHLGFVIGHPLKRCPIHGMTKHILSLNSSDEDRIVCELCWIETHPEKEDSDGY